jgi:hypothetical protein
MRAFGGIKYVSPTSRQWRPKNAAVILFAASEVAGGEFRCAQRVGRLAAATTGSDEIYAGPLRTASQKLADTRPDAKKRRENRTSADFIATGAVSRNSNRRWPGAH